MTTSDLQRPRAAGARLAAMLLLVVAWTQPFAPGPSPTVVPWMAGAACTLGLWALSRRAADPRLAGLCLGLLLAAWLPHASGAPELLPLAAGLTVLVLAAAAARSHPAGWQLGLLTAATLSAVLGLAQAFGLAAPLAPWVSSAQIGQAYANLRQPNHFGTLCWLGVAVLLWGRPRLRPLLAWSLGGLLGVAAAASASRTAAVQMVLLGLLALAWSQQGRRHALGIWGVAVAGYAAASLLLPDLIRWTTGQDPSRALIDRLGEGGASCGSRQVLWRNAVALIAQRPWAGWGWGDMDFAHFWTLYTGRRFCDILDNAHNLPLHLAVELGLPVALLATGGALAWLLSRRPWAARAGSHRLAWAMLALIGLHSLLEYPLWYAPFQLSAGLALGVLLDRRPAGPQGLVATRAASALLAVALAWAAWDYARVSQAYRAPEQRWASLRTDPAARMHDNWLFSRQARFAELWIATPTPDSAADLHALAMSLLHYSPEPRVIEQAIASARLAGREADASALEERYRIAFPERWAGWRAAAQR